MRMVRLGFVGFGRMGITHFSILNSHPNVQVLAMVDSSTIVRSLAESYLKVKTFSNHEDMCQAVELDGLVVSTPNDSHAAIIEFALERGLHVFVEKPFTMNRGHGERIVESLNGSKLVTQVGYVNRFNEVFQAVKSLLQADVLGKVVDFRSEMHGRTVLTETNASWRGRKETGGGVLFDLGSHCIDMAVYLMGKPDKVCGSSMQRIYSSDVEDMFCSTFVYNAGMTGSIKANWSDESFRKATSLVEIVGSKGKLIADAHGYKLYLREPDETLGFEKGWNHRYITDIAGSVRFYLRGNEFTRQMDHFIDCIEKGKTDTICTVKDAFITDCLLEEVRKDADGKGAGHHGASAMSAFDDPNPVMKKCRWEWLRQFFRKECR
jgi:predicted dehydrogenase